MGDPDVSQHPGRRRAAAQEQAGVPPMPLALPGAGIPGIAYPLLDGLNPTLGWQSRPPAEGGPVFVIIRRPIMRPLQVVESFPLTEDGWTAAWQSLVRQNPAATRPWVLARLGAQGVDGRTLTILREVTYLGGYVPGAAIRPRGRYDVRFTEDRLEVFASRQLTALAVVPYSQVEDVEIGGPGLVKTGGGFVGGGFGVNGAVEGMAIAAVLNGLTTRTSIKTVVRIQGSGCELFLLHTMLTPAQLRIEMSRPLGVIRSARAAAPAGRGQDGPQIIPPSPAEELSKLADMLEKGLLTREEFNLMKAKLIGGPTI